MSDHRIERLRRILAASAADDDESDTLLASLSREIVESGVLRAEALSKQKKAPADIGWYPVPHRDGSTANLWDIESGDVLVTIYRESSRHEWSVTCEAADLNEMSLHLSDVDRAKARAIEIVDEQIRKLVEDWANIRLATLKPTKKDSL